MTPVTMVKRTVEESCVSGVAYEQLSPEKQKIVDRIRELEQELATVKGTPCEVYSRIVGYFRPIKNWNEGKQSEFNDRVVFTPNTMDVPNGKKVTATNTGQ